MTGKGQELYRKGQQFAKGTKRGQTQNRVNLVIASVYV